MRYSFTNNSIERLTTMVNDNNIAGLQNPTGKDVLYSTYENIGKTRSAALSAYVNWNATKNTRIYVNMNGQWQYFSDGKDLSNRGWEHVSVRRHTAVAAKRMAHKPQRVHDDTGHHAAGTRHELYKLRHKHQQVVPEQAAHDICLCQQLPEKIYGV